MHYAREDITLYTAVEIESVLNDYYITQNGVSGLPPYELDWRVYAALNEANSLVLICARDDAEILVGFVLYMLVKHPHHKDMLVAECDIIVVAERARGQGVGKALMQHAEPYLVLANVNKVIHREKFFHDAKPLFPKLGYVASEMSYVKELK